MCTRRSKVPVSKTGSMATLENLSRVDYSCRVVSRNELLFPRKMVRVHLFFLQYRIRTCGTSISRVIRRVLARGLSNVRWMTSSSIAGVLTPRGRPPPPVGIILPVSRILRTAALMTFASGCRRFGKNSAYAAAARAALLPFKKKPYHLEIFVNFVPHLGSENKVSITQ